MGAVGLGSKMKDYSGHNLKLKDNLSIVGMPYTLLKELNWNTSDQIIIIDHDDIHKTITIGKKLSGKEAVESMQKIREDLQK
jgi:bifunctional DNA-binding transcriptional regulator/antitoxin component of YhaV-PrlF toxin-antitoxin module